MAKRLAALEAKSAIPPQPAPKLERPLAPGWQRLRAGNVGTCPCGGVAVFFYGENVVCCDAADCMRKLGVFAPLASAESAWCNNPKCQCDRDHRGPCDLRPLVGQAQPPPPVAAPTCKNWCGRGERDICKNDGECWLGDRALHFCSLACRDAGKTLNPKPQPAAAPAKDCEEWCAISGRHEGGCLSPTEVRGAAAPAPGGTNRERAIHIIDTSGPISNPAFLRTLLDEAESRGRNAAHGKAVKAWRELGAIERGFVVATIEMWRDDYRRHGLSEPFSHAMDVARAALAELAGTGDGK